MTPFPDFSRAFSRALVFMFVALCLVTPLAAWKLIEIVWWFFSHLRWVS